MNYEYFIAKRLIRKNGKKFSRPIVIIATISISLGIAVMILSLSILQGFKTEIKEKIIGFGSHVQIVPYSASESSLIEPLILEDKEKVALKSIKNIKSIHPFVSKGGVIKTNTDFQGIMAKGIDKNYDTSFFSHYLIKGRLIRTNLEENHEAIISRYIADKLNLNIGDKLRIFFYADNNYRARAFNIVGVYETGLGVYDKKVIICDIAQVQSLNNWQNNEVEGYEIMLNDFNLLEQTANDIYYATEQNKSIKTIQEVEPNLFTWLDLLDSNVIVILIIMILVSIVTITSTLLILIFERTQTIGILKGFGATNRSITKIFLYNAAYIITQGILYGNTLAIGIGLLQSKFHFFKLDPESYYLNSVPIQLSLPQILMINIGTILICLLALLIPSKSISKISPIKSIRFEQ